MQSVNSHEQEPIKIVGVVDEEVGVPRNDGGPGSELYEVPFRLSRPPSEAWAEFFVDAWNRPPKATSMHRPGIAHVVGDTIILDSTTIEEVERYHLKTLKLAIERANELAAKWRQREKNLSERQEELRHRVREVAKRLKFD
jgi:hypothetical protein